MVTADSYATLPPKPKNLTATAGAGSGKLTLAASVTGTAALEKWQYKKKKDGGSYDADWTDISSTSKSLSHTVSGLTDGSAYQFKVRARERLGLRRRVGRVGRGHPAGGDPDRGHRDGDRHDPDHRRPFGGLVLRVLDAERRRLLHGGGGRDEDVEDGDGASTRTPPTPSRRTATAAARRSWRRVALRDPAAAAGEADADGEPGQRQGEAHLLGGRRLGGADQVAVQEEARTAAATTTTGRTSPAPRRACRTR